ncbi:ABC transporter permease [Xylophilus sp. GW821-FHT01B05]
MRRTPYLSLAFLLACALLVLLAPWLAPHGINDIVGGNWDGPSSQAWLGTDNLGRDALSRLIFGTRTTLGLAALSTVLAFATGGVLGLFAGLRGGHVDSALSRINDVFMSIPTLVFALVVLSVVPSGAATVCLVVAALEAMRVFRVARALAADAGALDYVEVARLRGEGSIALIFREVLPNVAQALVAEFGLRLVFAVLLISTLSFLGLGLQPPATDWGSLAKENKDGVLFGVWAALIPGAAIALLSLSINALLDWISHRREGTA